MRRTLLSLFASLALFLGYSAAAEAHVADTLMWRPYVIEQTCNDHLKHCKSRMKYPKGQNPGTAKAGSYFYQKAKLGRHGDFRLTVYGTKIPHQHYHKKRHTFFGLTLGTRHKHNRCRHTGWGFDHKTGTWAWMPKQAACIRTYDGP